MSRHIDPFVWCIIVVIIIGWAFVETVGNQFTEPLMEIFEVNEHTANLLLSMEPIYALTVANVLAFIISKYGYLSWYFLGGSLLMMTSMLLLFLYSLYPSNNNSDGLAMGVICTVLVCYIVGEHCFFSSAFTCLFLSCPLKAVPIINTVSSVGYMLGSLLQNYFFGLLADESGSFSYSMLMTEVLLVVGLAFSAIVFVIDLIKDGPLHKAAVGDNAKAKAEQEAQKKRLLQHDKVRVYT